MENNCLIHMLSVQIDSDGEEQSEFTTEGSLIKKGEKFYLSFAESGIEGFRQAKTTLKVTPENVTMLRYAPFHTQMIFEAGGHYSSFYQTPFGNMSMTVITRSMAVNIGEEGGRIYINYLIDMGDMPSLHHEMTITIRKK